ncbi:MAG: hypothetical protein WCW02_00170 [Candidatus Buchananbacteria bacterium]
MPITFGSLARKNTTNKTITEGYLRFRHRITNADIIKNQPKKITLNELIKKNRPTGQSALNANLLNKAATELAKAKISEAGAVLSGQKQINSQQAKKILKILQTKNLISSHQDSSTTVDNYLRKEGVKKSLLTKRHLEDRADELAKENFRLDQPAKNSNLKTRGLPPLMPTTTWPPKH